MYADDPQPGSRGLKSRNQLRASNPKQGLRSCRSFHRRVLPTIAGVIFGFAVPGLAAAQASTKNVLILFSSTDRDSDHWRLFELSLRSRFQGQITFYHAYLEDSRVTEKSYRDSQAETYRRTYAGVKLDLFVATDPVELQFAVQYRDSIFPGVPIVFTGVSKRELEDQSMWPGVTGLTVPVGIPETIDLALRLHPDTKTIAVISQGAYWSGPTRSELFARHVSEIELLGPASPRLLEQVAALPAHTVILFELAPEDSSLPAFSVFDVLRIVAQRLPTYSPWPSLCLNYGCVGGAFEDTRKEMLSTADIAARILSGERPDDIPVVRNTDLRVTVDWRALQRWHVPDSDLPPGTLVLYREPTLWERGRKYFLAGIAMMVVQSLLIFGLLWQRARTRKAEAVLRESEKRFRVMADTTPSLIWMCDDQGRVTYLNEQWLALTGSDPNTAYGDMWRDYAHPDDVKSTSYIFSRAVQSHQSFSNQCRLRCRDGTYRWLFAVASPG